MQRVGHPKIINPDLGYPNFGLRLPFRGRWLPCGTCAAIRIESWLGYNLVVSRIFCDPAG